MTTYDEHASGVVQQQSSVDVRDDLMTIKVRFGDTNAARRTGHCYDYGWRGRAPTPGDTAVVRVADDYCLVRVVKILTGRSPRVTKHLVAVIDATEYDAREAREHEAAELLEQLKAAAARVDLMTRLREVAREDPTTAGMMRRYEALRGGA